MEKSTNRLGHFEYSFLAGEQDGGGQDALNDLAANAFVQALDAFLFDDGHQGIQ